MTDVDDVLSFWLGPEPATEAEVGARRKLWFTADEKVDREIRDRFGALVESARADQLEAWAETPRGAVALIVLIDQFSRNIYRGSGEAFAHDEKALRVATQGYDSERFGELGPTARLFAAMPFHHAEDLESQKRGVRLAVHDALTAQPPFKPLLVQTVDSARRHLDVIARFGRFPHRNVVLGRPSTPDEQEYLEYLKLAGQWL
jgi:uncharacterized protein (DUF924 family)